MHIRTYTTAVDIDPNDAEDIFWQQLYNAMHVAKKYNYSETKWRAYAHFGMIRGFKVVINFLMIDD